LELSSAAIYPVAPLCFIPVFLPIAFYNEHGTMANMTLAIPSYSFLTDAGLNVELFSEPSDLTVAQAAVLLDMPEACVNDLLNIGVLKFRQENGERLLLRDPLLEYKERCEFRRVGLDKMVRWNQEMGLYDD
jgi:hypothetical protein